MGAVVKRGVVRYNRHMEEYKVSIETIFTVKANSVDEVENEVRLTLEKADIGGIALDFHQWNSYILIEDKQGRETMVAYD